MKDRLVGKSGVGLAVAAAMAVTAQVGSVCAGDIVYQFQTAYDGPVPGPGNGPWVEAAFHTLKPGLVQLSISNVNLTASENVDALFFNLNPKLNPRLLQIKAVGGSGGFVFPRISTGYDVFKAGGGDEYDIKFQFSVRGPASGLFGDHEYVIYDIYGLGTLTAMDFAYPSLSLCGKGAYYAAAHLQRIGQVSASDWLGSAGLAPVPEPCAAIIGALAGALWATVRRVTGRRAGLLRQMEN